jgi:hypothetical protein
MTKLEGVRNPVSKVEGERALEICTKLIEEDLKPENSDLKTAVKYSLQILYQDIPGKSVELRIPPFAAVSIIEGKDHKRGTPPATIEIEAITWLKLSSGLLNWAEALKAGLIYASGPDTDLTTYLPIHKNKTNE